MARRLFSDLSEAIQVKKSEQVFFVDTRLLQDR